MRLLAISDLHVGHPENRRALEAIADHADDWLIVAGDVGESVEDLDSTLRLLTSRFAKTLWVPGNHELWRLPGERLGGVEKYAALVERCRELGVATPEDPFVVWPGPGGPCAIALLFLGYDYSFRPDHVSAQDALAWAQEAGIECVDEHLLDPAPFASRSAWCHRRCDLAEPRLEAASSEHPLVLVNHYPLRHELVHLPSIPRFSIWCGTKRTESWHTRFRARVVVSGHLHVRTTQWLDATRFEEVSLGYPRQRRAAAVEPYLREILPGPSAPASGRSGPQFRF